MPQLLPTLAQESLERGLQSARLHWTKVIGGQANHDAFAFYLRQSLWGFLRIVAGNNDAEITQAEEQLRRAVMGWEGELNVSGMPSGNKLRILLSASSQEVADIRDTKRPGRFLKPSMGKG